MTDKRMREILDELAGDAEQSPEDYLLSLVKAANDGKMEKFKGYPEEVAKQLIAAEKLKSDSRKAKYAKAEKDDAANQISDFVKNFPGVSPEDVPEEVWNEVGNGVSLSHAYALWKHRKIASGAETASGAENANGAEEINAENTSRALPVENDRSEPLAFTKEEVERMPSSAVKGNYKKILNSMKRWKF